MLSRWAATDRPVRKLCRLKRQRKFGVGIINPLGQDDFTWPTSSEIFLLQSRAREGTDDFSCDSLTFSAGESGLFSTKEGVIWVPPDADQLQLRLIIIAHCGSAGHRGKHATLAALSSRFFWSGMRADIDEFLRQCLHCLPGKGGDVIQRPFGLTATPTKANEIIDFDYLYIGKSYCSFKYLLVIRDRMSGVCGLFSNRRTHCGIHC